MNGTIYKLTSPQTESVYVGSTTESIKSRMSKHKTNYKRYTNGKHNYVSSYEILKHNDAIIELLEQKEYKDKKEMFERERFFMNSIENTVNKNRCGVSHKESVEHDGEKFICECGGVYTRKNRNAHNKSKRHMKESEKIINITINITCEKVEIMK
jgi:hypothetical protein